MFFRNFVQTNALSLGLVGYVRNLDDGVTVEVEAHGPKRALKNLEDLLWKGPPGAWVDQIDVEWKESQDHHLNFEVAS